MREKVTPELIRRQGAELQNLDISDGRAAELAPEVEAINGEVIKAALELDFDDEPVGFFRLLRQEKPQTEDGR